MDQILVIDDSYSARLVVQQMILSIDSKCTVYEFCDPEYAFYWASENSPQLIITDFHMPKYNGLDLVKRFRSLPHCHDIPIVVTSIDADMTIKKRVIEAGANDFVHCQSDLESLKSTLTDYLSSTASA